jgi:rhodanese-related sulfurtransferase
VATPASGATPTRSAAGYFEWTVQDLKQALGKKDFVLVNVHIPFEGRLNGTDLEIPYDQITRPENLAKLPADKNARIVLYCRSGNMSNIAANALVKLGYTNLVDVKGGMKAWEAAGYSLNMKADASNAEADC